MPPAAKLSPGIWISVHKTSKPELNGSIGIVLGPAKSTERWVCTVYPSERKLSLNEKNLQVLAPANRAWCAISIDPQTTTSGLCDSPLHILPCYP